MPKAVELSEETMTAPPIPRAAQVAPSMPGAATARRGREVTKAEPKREPLQVRWPEDDIKAAKIASIQSGFSTVSDFMLACFHAYMKKG